MAFESNRVINGTYGTLLLGSTYLGECYGLEAKIEFDKADVVQCGTLIQGSKVTGIKCSGTVKMHKVTSYLSKLIADQGQAGSFPALTIVSTLADPDTKKQQKEEIKLTGVLFDETTLADWEAGNIGDLSYAFTFTGWQYNSSISDSSVDVAK